MFIYQAGELEIFIENISIYMCIDFCMARSSLECFNLPQQLSYILH